MRLEKDFLGEKTIPKDALYGIHSFRAKENFPGDEPFPIEWYRAVGTVKQACYQTIIKFRKALEMENADLVEHMHLPSPEILDLLVKSAGEVAAGKHAEHFIVPAIQGGAGTSIHLNVNEIIANRALQINGNAPGDYSLIDPIDTANIYQSTNDIIPTALTVAVMLLLNTLEAAVNNTRAESEKLENTYRHTLRLGFTQMQEAVPGTYGQLFSTYSDALSRDWWRISKAFERMKQVNLGGGATGTAISIPRFYIMEVVKELRKITGLPLAQAENLSDATCNLDAFVEVHAILKAHAVNMEKIANDLRLLSSGVVKEPEVSIPAKQTGSSIMPGKVNPVIAEYIISGAHQVYSNDQLITNLAAQGMLDLNAYLPSIGYAIIASLKLMISMNASMQKHLLSGIRINEELAANRLYCSPAVTTALSPYIGYNRAALLAKHMKENRSTVFDANAALDILPKNKLEVLLKPENLLKKGFTVKDIRAFKEQQ